MSADRVESLIAQGREHYNAGEFEQAEPFLAEAASVRPSFPDLYQSVNWTMVGILAHESALKGGEKIHLPNFRGV